MNDTWESVLHRFTEVGELHATKKAERIRMEKLVDMVKAEAFLTSRADGSTVAEAEAMARASQEYRQAVACLIASVETEEKAKIQVEAIRIWFEMTRTESADRRAEMNLSR